MLLLHLPGVHMAVPQGGKGRAVIWQLCMQKVSTIPGISN